MGVASVQFQAGQRGSASATNGSSLLPYFLRSGAGSRLVLRRAETCGAWWGKPLHRLLQPLYLCTGCSGRQRGLAPQPAQLGVHYPLASLTCHAQAHIHPFLAPPPPCRTLYPIFSTSSFSTSGVTPASSCTKRCGRGRAGGRAGRREGGRWEGWVDGGQAGKACRPTLCFPELTHHPPHNACAALPRTAPRHRAIQPPAARPPSAGARPAPPAAPAAPSS